MVLLVGLYTDIDNILREACGMSYGKATELCKEVQKNTLPLMVFIKEKTISRDISRLSLRLRVGEYKKIFF